MKTKTLIVFLLILYSLLSYQYIQNHFYDINPDGVSYIEIAILYKTGNFKEAINAYWSPIYSFVLILLSYVFDWITSTRILTLLLNPLWLIGSYLLTSRLLHSKSKAFMVIILCFLFPLFHESWKLITPDYLLTTFSTYLLILFFIIVKRIPSNYGEWIIFGIFAGIGYLIKSYFLIFSLIFFPLSLLVLLGRKFIIPTIFFLIGISSVIIIWSSLIFWKYGYLSTGTSVNVIYKNSVLLESYKFLERPIRVSERNISFWTDPSDFTSIDFDFNKQLQALGRNINDVILFIVKRFYIGIIFILLGLYRIRINGNKEVFILFLFTLVWILLYSIILVESRYLWPIITPLLIILVNGVKKKYICLLSFYYLYTIFFFLRSYNKYLLNDKNTDLHLLISQKIVPPCTIISDKWDRGLYISFFSGCKYFGITQTSGTSNNKEKVLSEEVIEGKVTHFIAFNGPKYRNIPFLSSDNEWDLYGFDIILYTTNIYDTK